METQTKLSAKEIVDGLGSNKEWYYESRKGLFPSVYLSKAKGGFYEKPRIIVNESPTQYDGSFECVCAAIVEAVNNTWLKGIDPESVPDLVAALKAWIDYMDSDLSDGEKYLLQKTKSAILKAEIK